MSTLKKVSRPEAVVLYKLGLEILAHPPEHRRGRKYKYPQRWHPCLSKYWGKYWDECLFVEIQDD